LRKHAVALQLLLEPIQPDEHDNGIDEANVRQQRDEIYYKLLVQFEILDVDAVMDPYQSVGSSCKRRRRTLEY